MSLSHPSSDDLIQALQTFLIDRVTPQVDKQTAFHIKVACHILNILKRELGAQTTVDTIIRTQLLELLSATDERQRNEAAENLNRLLCDKIRDRSLSIDDPQLLAALRQITEARLTIDNPDYSGLAQSRARHKNA